MEMYLSSCIWEPYKCMNLLTGFSTCLCNNAISFFSHTGELFIMWGMGSRYVYTQTMEHLGVRGRVSKIEKDSEVLLIRNNSS